MEWFDRVVLGAIRDMMRAARDTYGVDPVAFIVIYLVSVPFFYYSIFRMLRALARRQQQGIVAWSMVFLGCHCGAVPLRARFRPEPSLVGLRGDRPAPGAGGLLADPQAAEKGNDRRRRRPAQCRRK